LLGVSGGLPMLAGSMMGDIPGGRMTHKNVNPKSWGGPFPWPS